MPSHYDVAVVGGGIIGLATARELLLRGTPRVALLEAEPALAQHQTGHNSGVVHAGLYYTPGSLKARLCRDGMHRSYAYFDRHNIPYRKVGKLVVALVDEDRPRLATLFQNAQRNGVPGLILLQTAQEIRNVEPECGGVAAIHSPHTGIVDWGLVARRFGDDIRRLGGHIFLSSPVVSLRRTAPHIILSTSPPGTSSAAPHSPTLLSASRVITCAGAQSDRVASLLDGAAYPCIIPVRGEYLRVTNSCIAARIRGNIYPLPPPHAGPSAPFLGVHFTPTMCGEVLVGPNAVLALSRNGYRWRDVSARDVWEMVRYAGFWRMAWKWGREGVGEVYRSVVMRAAVERARKYVPGLGREDFERWGGGVRAQAVGEEGMLVDDFVFEGRGGVLHVRNAPSPGATSALAIAEVIVDRSEGGG